MGCFYNLLSVSKNLLVQNCSSLAFTARGDCWHGNDPESAKTGAETLAHVPLQSLITGVGCEAIFELVFQAINLLSMHLPTALPVCSWQRAATEQFAMSGFGWERRFCVSEAGRHNGRCSQLAVGSIPAAAHTYTNCLAKQKQARCRGW